MNFFDNHFLFSETYIKNYLKDKKKDREFVEVINEKFRLIKDWYSEYTKGDYLDSPWPEYIDTVLDTMGFQKRVDKSTRLLYSDIIAENIKPVTICYVIDKEESVATTVKGKYYAYDAISEAKKNNVNWAFLTNGNIWRLYNTKNISPYENYLEVDIENSIKNNNDADEAFSLFYLLFNVRTYYFEDGDLIIERIKDESDEKAEIIEETLRGKAEDILKELCYGLKEDIGKESFTEEERKGIYNDAIILLYRMLFFGYAESRGLLPVKEDDLEYKERFFDICEDAREAYNSGAVLDIKDGFEFWNRLDSQLRIYVDRTYNGGLFHNEDKPILKEHRIANGRLIKCLVELSFNRDKNGQYVEKIEYKDLSVRNLGAIYEGLLEYRLFIAEERMVQRKSKNQVKYFRAEDIKLQNSDLKNIINKGEIYLSQDALERKETGAYYTPEDVVEYIVNNTVGKRLEELRVELQKKVEGLFEQLSYEPIETRRRIIQRQIDEITINFINTKILNLSILDSAMGSGHFLVNAAYKVANEIVDIISSNNWSNEDIIVDIKYWKRKVVENCIYGVDINGLSVALAKLSLWLISASNDKALSFIDHHLKQGNSIIGTNRWNVEVKDSKYPLFGVSYEEYMSNIIKKYKELRAIGSNTKDDVLRQQEIYKEINNELTLIKKKYDYYLASQYAGGITDTIKYINLLRSNDIADFESKEVLDLLKIADEKQFFHWELEFPEVLNNGGFDIVIGNPPYVDVSKQEYTHTMLRFPETTNLYSYMIDNNLNYVKKSNFDMSYIVPLSLICSDRMLPLRDYLRKNLDAGITFTNIDSSTHPGTLFKGLVLRLTIVTINKRDKNNGCNSLKSTNYIKFYSNERKYIFNDIKSIDIEDVVILNGIVPKVGHEIEKNILKKLIYRTDSNASKAFSQEVTDNYIYYRTAGINVYASAFEEPPLFKINGMQKVSSGLKKIYLKDNIPKHILICLFYSSLFYWFWTVYSDCYNLKMQDIIRLPIDLEDKSWDIEKFQHLYEEIISSMYNNGKHVTYNKKNGVTEYFEFKPRLSKNIFDRVDRELATYYGLDEDEYKFIINYDLKYRVDDEETDKNEL